MTEDQNSEPNRALELADELERITLLPAYYADELTLIAKAQQLGHRDWMFTANTYIRFIKDIFKHQMKVAK